MKFVFSILRHPARRVARHVAQNWEKQFNTLQNVKVLIYFQRLFKDLIESVELIVTSKPFLNVTNARNVVISF